MTNEEGVPLEHPCRDTCSGWKQGYDRGRDSLEPELRLLQLKLEIAVEALEFGISSASNAVKLGRSTASLSKFGKIGLRALEQIRAGSKEEGGG